MRGRVLTFATIALSVIRTAVPQLSVAQVPVSDRAAVFGKLPHTSPVRLYVRDTGTMYGHFAGFTGDSLRLRVARDTVSLFVNSIDTVWVRETKWRTGAIIGGAMTGSLLAYGFSGLCEYAETSDSCGAALVGGLTIGAVPGLIAGAIVGSTMQRWERKFPPVTRAGTP